MAYTVEEMPRHKIAYMRQVGPYGANNQKLMGELKSWAASNNLLNDSAILFGIAHDNPKTTLPEDCRYDACIVVPQGLQIEGGAIRAAELPGGRYTVFTVAHTAEDIQKAWGEILPELSKDGCCADFTRPILERYRVGMVNNHLCEICVPL